MWDYLCTVCMCVRCVCEYVSMFVLCYIQIHWTLNPSPLWCVTPFSKSAVLPRAVPVSSEKYCGQGWFNLVSCSNVESSASSATASRKEDEMSCTELEDKISYEIETNASDAGVNTKTMSFYYHTVYSKLISPSCARMHTLMPKFWNTPSSPPPLTLQTFHVQKQTHESQKTHTTQPYMCYERTRIMYFLTHVISRMHTIHLVQCWSWVFGTQERKKDAHTPCILARTSCVLW